MHFLTLTIILMRQNTQPYEARIIKKYIYFKKGKEYILVTVLPWHCQHVICMLMMIFFS